MKIPKNLLLGVLIILSVLVPVAPATAAPQKGSVLVGHVYHTEGDLLYFVQDSKDWVAAVSDAPFGIDDAFYSGEDGKAEFLLPNKTRLRIGPTTQVQLIALKENLTQIDVAAGTARLFNDSATGIIKATTPFGYVVAEQGSFFDLYVGDQSVEIIPIEGPVDFVSEQGTRYPTDPGASLISDGKVVTDGDGTVDSAWQVWNDQRDDIRSKKLEVKGRSVNYLPDGLYDESPVLEEHGRWETVYYEGQERDLWRPTNVGSDWRPFTAGRWTTWHGDNAWIPEEEPFGYVTHHYGNWVYMDSPGAWYWVPPVVLARAHPTITTFSWYPGRVGWVHSGVSVGWFPLAPLEPYYAHRYWGPRTTVVSNVASVNININTFRFVNHPVVVPVNDLYSVRSYRGIRLANIDRGVILRDFRPAPVLDRRFVRNLRLTNQRFQFTPRTVQRVPHNQVLRRIERNRALAARAATLRAASVEQNLRRLRQGTLARDVRVQQPRVTNALVNRNQAAAARRQLALEQRNLKRQTVQLQRANERRQRAAEIRQQRLERQQRGGQTLQQQQRQEQLQQRRQRQQEIQQQRQQQQQQRLQQRQEAVQRQRQQRLERQEQQRQRQLQRREQQQQQRQQREQALRQQRQQRQERQQQLRQQQIQRQEQQRQRRQEALQRQRQQRQQSQEQLRQRQLQRQQQLQQQRQNQARELQQRRQRQQALQQQRQQRQLRQEQLQQRQQRQALQRRMQNRQQVQSRQSRQGIQQQRQTRERALRQRQPQSRQQLQTRQMQIGGRV